MEDVENGMVDYTEPKYKVPVCPVCGETCRWLYKREGEVIGCDECVEEVDAWEEQND